MSALPTDLLTQAEMLCRVDVRRPKQANLRRAVSSAYYALFHFLIEEATLVVVGASPKDKAMRQLVGRGFSHTAMREASLEMGKPTPKDLLKPFWTTLSVPISTCVPLQRLASAFVDLQQERHRADYDLSRPLAQGEADYLVRRAQSALADWQSLKKAHPDLARFYALSLYSWNNWKTR